MYMGMMQNTISEYFSTEAFGHELRSRQHAGIRAVVWIGLIFYPLTLVLDFVFVPDSVLFFAALRLVLLAVVWITQLRFSGSHPTLTIHLLTAGLSIQLLWFGSFAGITGFSLYAILAGLWLIFTQFSALWSVREGFIQIFAGAVAWLLAASQWPEADLSDFLLPGGVLYMFTLALAAFMPDLRLTLESRFIDASLFASGLKSSDTNGSGPGAAANIATSAETAKTGTSTETGASLISAETDLTAKSPANTTSASKKDRNQDLAPPISDTSPSESNLTAVLTSALNSANDQARHRSVNIELIRPDTDLIIPGSASDLRRALGDITGYLLDLTENTTLQIALEVESSHVSLHFVITDSGLAFIKPTDLFEKLRRFGKVRKPADTNTAVSVGIILPFVKKLDGDLSYCVHDHLEAYFIARFPLIKEIPA
jgi:hypothetical protein